MFAALAAHGHTYPSIPLATRCGRNAGHDVVFAAGEQFLPTLRARRSDRGPAGHRAWRRRSPASSLARASRSAGSSVTSCPPDGRGPAPLLAEHRPDAVVHDVATLGAPLAGAVARRCPRSATRSAGCSSTTCPRRWWPPTRRSPPSSGLDPSALTAGPVFDICPESVQYKDFLDAGGPGTAAAGGVERVRRAGRADAGPPARLPDARHGVRHRGRAARRDRRAGAAPGRRAGRGRPGARPGGPRRGAGPHVRVRQWVSQAAVLPHVDLVVHHGGSGTMLGAFAAGKPQLCCRRARTSSPTPTRWSPRRRRPAAARRAEREAVTVTARALLADHAVRAAAGRLADEIAAMPSPGRSPAGYRP